MKIGIFLPNATFDLPGTAEVGGIEVYAMDLGDALLSLGHDVVLFGGIPRQQGKYRAMKMRLRLSSYWETKDILKLGTRFRKLIQRLHFAYQSRHALREENCDVIFVFKPYDFINSWLWKKRNPHLCVVMNYQGKDFFPTDHFWRKAIDWEYACSRDNADLVFNRYGVRPDVFPNGVDTDFFVPRYEKKFQRHLVSAGRLVGWKGLLGMAEALIYLKGWRWTIAGDGPEKEKLLDYAKYNNIEDRINFIGTLSNLDLRDHFASADIMVQPSIDFDACPTAVLQALSAGVPVVLSDKVGLAKDVETNGAGFVYNAGKSKELASQFLTYENMTSDDRLKMSQSARLLIERCYSLDMLAKKISMHLTCLRDKKRIP